MLKHPRFIVVHYVRTGSPVPLVQPFSPDYKKIFSHDRSWYDYDILRVIYFILTFTGVLHVANVNSAANRALRRIILERQRKVHLNNGRLNEFIRSLLKDI